MRLRSLNIENFRAIESFQVKGLSDFIVIAGPNGCGKSTVLDAVRLMKSIYVPDEWNRWFGEFQIQLERPVNFPALFRDKNKPVKIEAILSLSDGERSFLSEHASNIALALALNYEVSSQSTITGDRPLPPPNIAPTRFEELKKDSEEVAQQIKSDLAAKSEFVWPAPDFVDTHLS